MVVYLEIFLKEGKSLVDSATALQWRYLPWSTGPLHCNGAIYHGRQGHRIAMELSTMVDRAIALRWRYLPKTKPPPLFLRNLRRGLRANGSLSCSIRKIPKAENSIIKRFFHIFHEPLKTRMYCRTLIATGMD